MEREFALANGAPDLATLEAYQRACNTMRRLFEAVGFQRRSRDVTPTLSEYLRAAHVAVAADVESQPHQPPMGCLSLRQRRSRYPMTPKTRSTSRGVSMADLRVERSRADLVRCYRANPRLWPDGIDCLSRNTTALEMIGPTPGMLMSRWQLSSCFAIASTSLDTSAIRSSRLRQSWISPLMRLIILGDSASDFALRISGSALRNGMFPCRIPQWADPGRLPMC